MNIARQIFILDEYYLNLTHHFISATQIIFDAILELVISCVFAKANFCTNSHIYWLELYILDIVSLI